MRPAIVLVSLLSLLSLPAAAERKPAATAQLQVTGPPGADVAIDGKRVGKLPFATQLVAGDHVIVVTRANHARFEKKLTLVAGKDVALVVELAPFTEVRVLSSPRGATVTIDGARRGTTPLAIAVEPGPHFFEIAHDGFQPRGERIQITGAQQNVEVTLEPVKP
jgi:hypothetical protein